MKKVIFFLFFVVAACVTAMALPTVDFGATTTNAAAVRSTLEALGIFVPAQIALTAVIAIMQLLKYFFPKIDGKN